MEKIDLRPKVLEIIIQKGPVIPRDIVREIGTDTFIVGAVLSKLRDERKIMVSNTKIGGSPTYYVSGQEEKLQNIADYLNEKDKKAYDFLSQKKVVRDKIQTPLMRVAFRSIKDFAKPLEVNIKGEKEIFWKWYLLPNSEVAQHVKSIIGIKEKSKEETKTKEIIKKEDKSTLKEVEDTITLLQKAKEFFEKNNIEVSDEKEVKKKKEFDFVVNVISQVGKTKYFCKARQKKRTNEGDISTAYVNAQSKKYPLLFLLDGELTKKAQKMIDDGEFENIIFKTL